MTYLDYRAFEAFLARHAAELPAKSARLVGRDRSHDSGYANIVRFFGPDAVDIRSLSIYRSDEPFAFDDPLIESYARQVASELRAAGRLYAGPMVTSLATDPYVLTPERFPVQLHVRPCDYSRFAGSCFALDQPDPRFGDHVTLREYAHHHRSHLPQCMGVCGLLITTEPDHSRRLLAVMRAGHLASLADSIGPSAAGSVDFQTRWPSLHELLHDSMDAEIAEELGLGLSDYTTTPLAFARELFRGGKPQLFCRIDTPLSSREILDRLTRLTDRPEFSTCFFFPLDSEGRLAPGDLARLNHEAAMNYWVREEHAANNQS